MNDRFFFGAVPSANPEVHGLLRLGWDTKISRPRRGGQGRWHGIGEALEEKAVSAKVSEAEVVSVRRASEGGGGGVGRLR